MKSNFFALIDLATTKSQLKAIVECLDTFYREDDSFMSEDDWPKLSKAVSDRMREIERADAERDLVF